MRIAILLFAAVVAMPVHAINKCVDAAGKTTYQEDPCSATAKASTFEPRDVAPPPAETQGTTRALEKRGKEMESERKLREIDENIDKLRRDIERYRKEKQAGIVDVGARPGRYSNPNARMTAVTAYYDNLIQEAESKIAQLKEDAAKIPRGR